MTAITKLFLHDLREKHDVGDAVFLDDCAPWLQAVLHDVGLRFQHVTRGNRNSVERVFKEVKIVPDGLQTVSATPVLRRRIVAASLRRLLESVNLNNARTPKLTCIPDNYSACE